MATDVPSVPGYGYPWGREAYPRASSARSCTLGAYEICNLGHQFNKRWTRKSSVLGVQQVPPRPKSHRKRLGTKPPTLPGGVWGWEEPFGLPTFMISGWPVLDGLYSDPTLG